MVHEVRHDVLVAIVRNETGEAIGFFPFHRIGKIAYPAGRCFNDAHNIIAARDADISWFWLLKEIGVKAYDFHALVGEDLERLGSQNYIGTIQSFRSDLDDDSEAFLAKLGKRHKTIGRQPQKTRKMAREVGAVELEIDCRDPELLDQVIQWKRNQYRRTDILDLFTTDWTRDLVVGLHDGSSFQRGNEVIPGHARGLLSVLRSGGKVVAGHVGIIEDGLLHYWFPAYDPEYARYSPGTALFTGIMAASTENGIRCIDMGYGEQPYKLKQTDTTTEVAFGCISQHAGYRHWRSLETAAIAAIKKAPMKETLKRIWRSVKPNAGISKLR